MLTTIMAVVLAFVSTKSSTVFHAESCRYAVKILDPNSLGNSQYFYDVNDAIASGKRKCTSCKLDPNTSLTAFQRAIIQSYGLPVALGDLNGNGIVDFNDWQRSCNKRCYRTAALWGRDANEVKWNLGLFIEAAQEANDVNAVRTFQRAMKSL